MRILIFGATGGTGRQLVDQALERGHQTTAFVRTAAKLAARHPLLRVVQGDALDWTIVQPGALTNGPRTGSYYVGQRACAGRPFPRISRADVAHFMLSELKARAFVRQTVSLCY
jgi:putative NADH-flavin reductase